MLAILASLVIAGAGVAALATIAVTVRAQAGAIGALLRDSRSIAQDREFLVTITSIQPSTAVAPAAPFAPSFFRLRRPVAPQPATRRAERPVVQPQRAAA